MPYTLFILKQQNFIILAGILINLVILSFSLSVKKVSHATLDSDAVGFLYAVQSSLLQLCRVLSSSCTICRLPVLARKVHLKHSCAMY